MQNDMMTFYNELSQTALKSANELIALNTRVLNETMDRQAKLSSGFVESSQKQADLLQFTQNPAEFVEKQTKLIEQYAEFFINVAKENMAIAQKTSDDYQIWFEQNASVADQLDQNPAPPVKKRATKRKAA